MRVLVHTPHPTFPLSHGGRVRTFRLAAALVRAGAAVDLICPWSPGQRGERVRAGVHVRPTLFELTPLLALSDDWLPSALPTSWQQRLPRGRRLIRDASRYDIVQFEAVGYAPWMESVSRHTARVFDAHNVEADFARRRAAGRLRRRLADRVVELERRIVKASDLVLACTHEDAGRLDELYRPSRAAAVVPNGFDDSLLKLDRGRLRSAARAQLKLDSRTRLLLFVGGGADHNRQAVRFIERELLDRLGAETRVAVIGKATRALANPKDPRLIARDHVDDLAPLLAAADVALNPVAYGSGANLKMAEYLAAGLPVVATSVGARGFERFSPAVCVAELGDFAEATRKAVAPGERPPGIEELGWGHVGQRLFGLYRELIGRSGG